MDPKKLERIISIVREEMMSVGDGGYTGSGDSKTKAGFDPVQIGMMRRTPPVYAKGGKGSRKNWLDYLRKQKVCFFS